MILLYCASPRSSEVSSASSLTLLQFVLFIKKLAQTRDGKQLHHMCVALVELVRKAREATGGWSRTWKVQSRRVSAARNDLMWRKSNIHLLGGRSLLLQAVSGSKFSLTEAPDPDKSPYRCSINHLESLNPQTLNPQKALSPKIVNKLKTQPKASCRMPSRLLHYAAEGLLLRKKARGDHSLARTHRWKSLEGVLK